MLRGFVSPVLLAAATFGLALFARVEGAAAAQFSVNPTRILLTARSTSALVTVRNDGDAPLRFQISVSAWDQDPQGLIQLTPTEDIVVFPLLMELPAKQERKLRVGAATAFGTREKSYRLIVEELPSMAKEDAPNAVRMLTRIGVPIFLEPAAPKASAALVDVGLRAAGLTFTLRNTGNVFFVPTTITVKGIDAQGATVLERSVGSWYVLAGGTRVYELPVPRPECERIRSLTVDVTVNDVVLKERLETPSSACSSP